MTKNEIFKIIESYPRKREPLPIEIKEIFDQHYMSNRESSVSQFGEKWLHTSMDDRNNNKKTLEIGAGTLNHLGYEAEREIYDIIEPKEFLFKKSNLTKRINNAYESLTKCPNKYYDRIISCAVLEHITDLPDYLYESKKKMKENGIQQHSIPCEGYPMWNIPWFIFSGSIFKFKYGHSFKHVMKHEHINTFDEIFAMIKFFYKDVEVKFSYPFYSKYLSFFANIKFSNPNSSNINKYVKLKKQNKI
tara:strand:+ start:260 stop:1000 length:741 start_codon:yes stop_codon:yes gene_type:complete